MIQREWRWRASVFQVSRGADKASSTRKIRTALAHSWNFTASVDSGLVSSTVGSCAVGRVAVIRESNRHRGDGR